jgi:hypothetical protein
MHWPDGKINAYFSGRRIPTLGKEDDEAQVHSAAAERARGKNRE